MDDFDIIEKELKEKESEKNITKHKVSGKSVFGLQKIIQEKANSKSPEEGSGDSGKTITENDRK